MNNLIYRLNKHISDSNWTLPVLAILILLSNLLLLFGHIYVFMTILCILVCLTIIRIRFIHGSINFDKTKYYIPQVGDRIIIKRGFYWNGSFSRSRPVTNISNKNWFYTIGEGVEYKVVDIEELESDWYITISRELKQKNTINYSSPIRIGYFESRKHWESLVTIRDKKLRKLGI